MTKIAPIKGFTLIELLLIIAMLLVLSVPTTAFSLGFIHQSAVRDASEGLTGMLREAQALSMLGKENSSWGVKKTADNFIIFCGEEFSSREPEFDQAFAINSHIDVSGFDETSFSRYGGFPATALPAVVISWGSAQESFALNSEGAIE